jgi:hypothetical protein
MFFDNKNSKILISTKYEVKKLDSFTNILKELNFNYLFKIYFLLTVFRIF